MARGYMGKILDINLSTGQMHDEPLDEDACRGLIGGYGIGDKLLYERLRPGVDPLGPENVLIFLTGPFTGTPALGGSRYVVVCKSPLTETLGDANSGGTWGPMLKFAGYDGVVFSGASDRPVYLSIENGTAELHDAAWLWGKDTVETDALLKERHGRQAVCACIGPAGEKLSRISSIINDVGRAAGRSGVGAVMGSKKLKAVVVKGDAQVPVRDEMEVRRLRRKFLQQSTGFYPILHKYGTVGITADSAMSGDSPVKNWGGAATVDFPQAQQKFRDDVVIQYQTKKYPCWKCNIGCGGYMEVKDGPYAGTKTHKVEYETAASFGSMSLNDDFPSLIKCNDIVNRAGLDSISAPAAVAFAIECFENGILTGTDTGGLELTWGNHRDMIRLLEQIASREGLGDILAEGVMRAAQHIGKGSEQFAVHVRGQEVPMHDPRFVPGLALTYKMEATPARHTQGGELIGPVGVDMPGADLPKYQYGGKGEMHKRQMALAHMLNATGGCLFAYISYPAQYIPEFLSAITGWDYTLDDCFTVGERIANLRHAFNLREGINPVAIPLHGRLTGNPPLKEGNVRGVTVDADLMVREYCQAMAWDPVTARPTPQRLRDLDLEYLIEDVC